MKIRNIATLFILLFMIVGISSCDSQTTKTTEKKEETTQTKKDTSTMKTNEIIVDVRTPEEWEFDGHANCSVNYPLDEIQEKIEELKKYDHIILVCRSGNRAGVAKRQLENAGITNIENLGAWQNINCN